MRVGVRVLRDMQAATVSVGATPIAASDEVPAPIAAAFVVFPPQTPLPAADERPPRPEPAASTDAREESEPRLATRATPMASCCSQPSSALGGL